LSGEADLDLEGDLEPLELLLLRDLLGLGEPSLLDIPLLCLSQPLTLECLL